MKRELKRIAEIIGFPEELVRRLPITMLFARARFKEDVICYTECYDLKDWLEKMDKYIELGNNARSLFKAALYYCEEEGKI